MISKVLSFIFFGLAWFVYKPPRDIRESQLNLTVDSCENKVDAVNGHAKENTSTSL